MPYRHVHEILLECDRDRLFRALTEIRRWPEWDEELAAAIHDGSSLTPGSRFTLTPKGGKPVALTVEACEPPRLFADLARLPLVRMTSRHELESVAEGRTRLRHVIETSGPLAWLWDRLVARKIAAGLETQARAMAAFARTLPL